MNYAIIIAGGSGARMNQDIPKQFINVFDKPIIIYTLEAFQKCKEIDGIIVVSIAGWDTMLFAYANQFGITKLKSVVNGGDCGQKSIFNGLTEARKFIGDEDIVLIHDAIRPMVSDEIICDCIEVTKKNGNAITVIPCQEAMLTTDDGEISFASFPRNQLKRTQAPQGFVLGELLGMHEEAKEKGITNSIASCTLAVELERPVFFSKGSEKNIKLTTPDDLDIFKALLKTERPAWIKQN